MTPPEVRINLYSLVSYLPDPLAGFLDSLRCELVPSCSVHAHVTVLPPRPLPVNGEAAWRHICALAPDFPCFDVELTEVRLFPVSGVLYMEIGKGVEQLREMHAVLNTGILKASEVFEYHPHITLAQDIGTLRVEELMQQARQRWSDFPHPRTFRVKAVTFVQSTAVGSWVDLGSCQLGTGETRLLETVRAQ